MVPSGEQLIPCPPTTGPRASERETPAAAATFRGEDSGTELDVAPFTGSFKQENRRLLSECVPQGTRYNSGPLYNLGRAIEW